MNSLLASLALVALVAADALDAQRLADALTDVRAAVVHRYQLKDDAGRSMDCLKVFSTGKGAYYGIHHTYDGGKFSLHLAESADLVNWKHVIALDEHASQGTVWQAEDGRFLLAYEKDAPNSCWIRLRSYAGLTALRNGTFNEEHDIARSLAPTAEGTPSFEKVEGWGKTLASSSIRLRFHYFKDAHVDQLAAGTLTGFSEWKAHAAPDLNERFIALGVHGNIGDRDRFQWQGRTVYLQEGQLKRLDWASWRVYLCDESGAPIQRLDIKTHGGSTAFCNPNATWLTGPQGSRLLVVTAFLPSEGSAPNESGSLLYAIDAEHLE